MKNTLFSDRSLELELSAIVTSAPVFACSSAVPTSAGIGTFKTAVEDDANDANKVDNPIFDTVVALMGPHSFSIFWRRVKTRMSAMSSYSFVIMGAVENKNKAFPTFPTFKSDGYTAKVSVWKQYLFLKWFRWLLERNLSPRVRSSSNSSHLWSWVINCFTKLLSERRLAEFRKAFNALQTFWIAKATRVPFFLRTLMFKFLFVLT